MFKFLLGFTTGAIVGALVHKLVSKEALANDLKNETEHIRAYYKKKFDVHKEETKKKEDMKVQESPEEKKEMYKTYSSLSGLYDGEKEKDEVQYDKYSKEDKPLPDDKTSDEPYWISQEQYDAEVHYEREELIYYEPNRLLTDADDVVIDVDLTIGFDCLNEEKVVNGYTHARNDLLKKVYEIEVKPTSFLDYYAE